MRFIALGLLLAAFLSCGKKDPIEIPDYSLDFTLKFDPAQERLNNLGQPTVLAVGHGALSPQFREMSLHYIELAPDAFTQFGAGAIVYKAPETTTGGEKAIDYQTSALAGNNETFCTLLLKDIPPGTYEWIRASVSYQNYDIKYNLRQIPGIGDLIQQSGTVSSFIGFNNYIQTVVPREKTLTVNANMPQGFWAFETELQSPYSAYNNIYFGQAPAGATTVVNPIANTSPVPAGSCVVTGKLEEPLTITGRETDNITIQLSFSVNKSFEWIDDNGNGQLDFYATPGTPNEKIVDMGVRGLKPTVIK